MATDDPQQPLQQITAAEISAWLENSGHSRDWLAEETGTSKGTVAGWLAKNAPRPIPVPTLKLIERLMCDDLLGEPQYTYDEAKVIRKAMTQEGYTSFRDFVRDAVTHNARRILAAEGALTPVATAHTVDGSGPADDARVIPFHSPWKGSGHWADLRGGVAAGSPIDAAAPEAIEIPHALPDDQHYCLRVFGRSMEPKIHDGALILVKEFHDHGFPRKGTIVVYSDGTGSTLKEFAYRKAKRGEDADAMGNIPVLRSLNKAFPDIQTLEGGRIDAVFVEEL